MAASLAGVSISAPRVVSMKSELPRAQLHQVKLLPALGSRRAGARRMVLVASSPSTPQDISEKVVESIEKAKQTCADNAESGECVAAWDEVEELSAAASHARDRIKDNSDPLENYCKENPETNECRTYDN